MRNDFDTEPGEDELDRELAGDARPRRMKLQASFPRTMRRHPSAAAGGRKVIRKQAAV
jgi:hypothetical protein